MARAALGWSIAELAEAADVGDSTVKRIEAADGVPAVSAGGIAQTLASRTEARAEAVERVRKALAGAGITFLADDGSGAGIRWKPKAARKR
jgi:transcriptional regulator with XRE-family HTH domain